MKQKYIQSVITLELDQEKCTGCKMCVEVCPHNVFKMNNKKAEIINKGYCMECGACEKNCPVAAINAGSGVGCAAAIYTGMIKKTAPTCGCGDNGCCG